MQNVFDYNCDVYNLPDVDNVSFPTRYCLSEKKTQKTKHIIYNKEDSRCQVFTVRLLRAVYTINRML